MDPQTNSSSLTPHHKLRNTRPADLAISALLAAIAGTSAVLMLTRQPELVESLDRLEINHKWIPVLGGLKLAGAAGILIGVRFRLVGVAAATGLTLFFLGAVATHLLKGDSEFAAAALLTVLCAACLRLTTQRQDRRSTETNKAGET